MQALPHPPTPPNIWGMLHAARPFGLGTQMPSAVHFYSNTLRRVLSVSKTCRGWPLSPSALTLELEVFKLQGSAVLAVNLAVHFFGQSSFMI